MCWTKDAEHGAARKEEKTKAAEKIHGCSEKDMQMVGCDRGGC